MQLRSFILAGVGAALCFTVPALAAMPISNTVPDGVVASDVVPAAAKSPSAELKQLKRKKKPSAEDLARIAVLEAQIKAERAAAKAKQIEDRKLALREAAKARAQADREAFLAKRESRAKPAAAPAASAKKPAVPVQSVQQAQQPVPAEAMNIALTGNTGELRSGAGGQQPRQAGLFGGLFGGAISSPSLLPETRALDSVLEARQSKRPFQVRPEFEPQIVEFSGYEPGTIVIDTGARRLYLVETSSKARRYAIAVGKDGLQYKGTTTIGDKQEWPRWIPTQDMQKREPGKYGQYKDGMAGGPDNPLGARAIYLYEGKKDTYLRIHGTNQPQTIGTSASNGCFRMINDHVMDLYRRVKAGSKVVVL